MIYSMKDEKDIILNVPLPDLDLNDVRNDLMRGVMEIGPQNVTTL